MKKINLVAVFTAVGYNEATMKAQITKATKSICEMDENYCIAEKDIKSFLDMILKGQSKFIEAWKKINLLDYTIEKYPANSKVGGYAGAIDEVLKEFGKEVKKLKITPEKLRARLDEITLEGIMEV